jgi:hypothetical protein
MEKKTEMIRDVKQMQLQDHTHLLTFFAEAAFFLLYCIIILGLLTTYSFKGRNPSHLICCNAF